MYSAPGLTSCVYYTYDNPVDPTHLFKRTIVTFYGDTLQTTASIEILCTI